MLNIIKKVNDKQHEVSKSYSSKYVIGYEFIDGKIKINSSNGDSRIVKNTKSNLKKIDKIVVESKIDIAKKIDGYEATFIDRLYVLLFCMILVVSLGFVSIFSFFIGSMVLFLISILSFSCAVIFSSFIGITYYLTMLDIRKLKSITGYKKEMEFEPFKFSVKALKK